jgi:hypothetical protein
LPRTSARTPDGVDWTIRRRWIPHREGIGLHARLRRRRARDRRTSDSAGPRWYDWLEVPSDLDVLGAIVVAVLVVLFVVFLGWPLILVGIDLAWLCLVAIAGTVGRVVLRRPWRVEATSHDERRDWYVSGFREAGRRRDDLADKFRHGANPMP